MLSNSAFNAMLKTLEEPPEHVKFILATTDPQKIPVTVLSRCLQFNLKQMTPSLIAAHLRHILDVESIAAEPGALALLSRSAAGSMRDALSLLDQAIAHGAGKVEEGQVRDMLGTVDLDYLFSILDALLAADVAGMLRVVDDMSTRSLSFAVALQELASLMTRIQVAQFAPQTVADDLPERSRILDLAGRFEPQYVQLAYQIAVQGRSELHLAPDERDGFVMTLLRLHAFRPAGPGDYAAQEGAAKYVVAPPVSRTAPTAPVESARPAPEKAAPDVAAAPAQAAEELVRESSASEPPDAAKALPETEKAPPHSPSETGSLDWHATLSSLKLGGMARELAQHCELRAFEGNRVFLRLSTTHRHLQMKSAQDKLQQVLSEHLGRPVAVAIELDDVIGDTPAAVAQRHRQERQEQAVASVEQDEFVREVIDVFDATLIESSIKPV